MERAYRKLRERDLVYASGIDLERYISCCPICQLSKPSYHKFYGELMPLVTPRETFLIDFYFTIGLPVAQPFEAIISVTCGYSKLVRLVPGKETGQGGGHTRIQ